MTYERVYFSFAMFTGALKMFFFKKNVFMKKNIFHFSFAMFAGALLTQTHTAGSLSRTSILSHWGHIRDIFGHIRDIFGHIGDILRMCLGHFRS